MKGSFWKKNIKEMKKEKKERWFKQKVKISHMEIQKTFSNALKSAVIDNEERQQQILQEEKVEQEPVEYCKLLLDANIFHDIFSGNEDVRTRLKNYQGGKNLLFLTLDRIITETKNMESYKHAEYYTYDEIIEQLSSLGEYEVVRLNHNSEFAHRAIRLCESEKYKSGFDEKPLSEADCYLLEYAIEYSCKLVTHDNTLYNATSEEIRLRADENEFAGATSAGVFDPHRT